MNFLKNKTNIKDISRMLEENSQDYNFLTHEERNILKYMNKYNAFKFIRKQW